MGSFLLLSLFALSGELLFVLFQDRRYKNRLDPGGELYTFLIRVTEDLTGVLTLYLELISAFGTLPFTLTLGGRQDREGITLWTIKLFHPSRILLVGGPQFCSLSYIA